jgi:hypothetical protein
MPREISGRSLDLDHAFARSREADVDGAAVVREKIVAGYFVDLVDTLVIRGGYIDSPGIDARGPLDLFHALVLGARGRFRHDQGSSVLDSRDS